jgi:hypothetical protein
MDYSKHIEGTLNLTYPKIGRLEGIVEKIKREPSNLTGALTEFDPAISPGTNSA